MLPFALRAALPLATGLLLSAAAAAASPTSTGEISVQQVIEFAHAAPSNQAIQLALVAYLQGTGETAGVLMAEAAKRPSPVTCHTAMSMDIDSAVAAVRAAAPNPSTWPETAATPIIVADMLARAGCR
ncbi:MAG: chlorophyllide reductase [Devosia sp.]